MFTLISFSFKYFSSFVLLGLESIAGFAVSYEFAFYDVLSPPDSPEFSFFSIAFVSCYTVCKAPLS